MHVETCKYILVSVSSIMHDFTLLEQVRSGIKTNVVRDFIPSRTTHARNATLVEITKSTKTTVVVLGYIVGP